MKKQSIAFLILLSAIIFSFRQEPQFTEKHDGSKTKLYYLDPISVDTTELSYRTGHLRLNKEHVDNFRFFAPTDTVEIFYDKSFSKIAERIVFIKKDSIEQYQRFDKEGNLTAEDLHINGNDWQEKTWGKNKNPDWLRRYDERGYEVSDTSFFENQAIKNVTLFINGRVYKEIFFYRNGKVEGEIYRSESDMDVFAIKYDSLTQSPSMYYRQDTVWEDKNNPGTFVGAPRLFPVDSVKIKGKTTKLPIEWIFR